MTMSEYNYGGDYNKANMWNDEYGEGVGSHGGQHGTELEEAYRTGGDYGSSHIPQL